MQTYDVTVDGHVIQISYSRMGARQVVVYDGKTVSEKTSRKFITPHSFSANEDGQDVAYRLALGSSLGFLVARDGMLVRETHHPGTRYLTTAGLMIGAVILLQLVLYLGAFLLPAPLEAVNRVVNDWWQLIVFLGAIPLSLWVKSLFLKRGKKLCHIEAS